MEQRRQWKEEGLILPLQTVHRQQGSAKGVDLALCVCVCLQYSMIVLLYYFSMFIRLHTDWYVLATHMQPFIWKCSNLLFIYASTAVLGDKYLQWVAVRSVFLSRLPNHAQHVKHTLDYFALHIWVNEKSLNVSWTHSHTTRHSSALQWCERDGKKQTTAWEKD